MKLLVDMNLAPRWTQWLATAGIDATHWSEVGHASVSDSEVMMYAARHGLVVLTHDLDLVQSWRRPAPGNRVSSKFEPTT